MIYQNFLVILCEIFKPQNYLELGVGIGKTFNIIETKIHKCIAVDISKRFNPRKGKFFEGTTDAFFLQNKEIFDMIFVDANHDFEFAKKDLNNSFKVLSQKGVIILHDTDPIEKRFLAHAACSDSYKLIDYLDRDHAKTFNHFTFPLTVEGITIITRKTNRRVLEFINENTEEK